MKTDSAPVRGDGYEPRSSKFRPRANAETSHSVRYDIVVVVASIVGGSKKVFIWDGEISKTTTVSTPYDSGYHTILLYDPTWIYSI